VVVLDQVGDKAEEMVEDGEVEDGDETDETDEMQRIDQV
jgi:hypothetical protein